MSLKLNSQSEFDSRLEQMTQGIKCQQIIKDDMTVAKKGGKAWALLSLFFKVFLIDINKHYRPQTVIPKMKQFFKANIDFIDDEAKKQAVCDVMRALDLAIVDRKGDRKYHETIADDKRIIKQMFLKRHPVAAGNNPPAAGSIPTPPPLPPSGNSIPTPSPFPQPRNGTPTPPPPPPANNTTPPASPPQGSTRGNADLLAAIRRGTNLKPVDNTANADGAQAARAFTPPTGATNLFGGLNPAAALNNLRPTTLRLSRRQLVQSPR